MELLGDPTQADVDRYGRLLRHVLIDGQSAALAALTAGAGYEYPTTPRTPTTRLTATLRALQRPRA